MSIGLMNPPRSWHEKRAKQLINWTKSDPIDKGKGKEKRAAEAEAGSGSDPELEEALRKAKEDEERRGELHRNYHSKEVKKESSENTSKIKPSSFNSVRCPQARTADVQMWTADPSHLVLAVLVLVMRSAIESQNAKRGSQISRIQARLFLFTDSENVAQAQTADRKAWGANGPRLKAVSWPYFFT
ncbi:hypothetical protein HAX54_045844 [Datura stramonium]|uniref:Uncharacterized protein n=1 Tax=Datura stramonium TaxID=4076 RepID=A0ABS8WK16_DATST|nr:hypothetical protein [Datura stramonium]